MSIKLSTQVHVAGGKLYLIAVGQLALQTIKGRSHYFNHLRGAIQASVAIYTWLKVSVRGVWLSETPRSGKGLVEIGVGSQFKIFNKNYTDDINGRTPKIQSLESSPGSCLTFWKGSAWNTTHKLHRNRFKWVGLSENQLCCARHIMLYYLSVLSGFYSTCARRVSNWCSKRNLAVGR